MTKTRRNVWLFSVQRRTSPRDTNVVSSTVDNTVDKMRWNCPPWWSSHRRTKKYIEETLKILKCTCNSVQCTNVPIALHDTRCLGLTASVLSTTVPSGMKKKKIPFSTVIWCSQMKQFRAFSLFPLRPTYPQTQWTCNKVFIIIYCRQRIRPWHSVVSLHNVQHYMIFFIISFLSEVVLEY